MVKSMSMVMRYIISGYSKPGSYAFPFLFRFRFPVLQDMMMMNVMYKYWHVYDMFFTVKKGKRKMKLDLIIINIVLM